jgi:hypothetical protein
MCRGWKGSVAAGVSGKFPCSFGALVYVVEQYIPSMLASYDWRVRHAGLMAIAAIGEGTGKVSILLLRYVSYSPL